MKDKEKNLEKHQIHELQHQEVHTDAHTHTCI